MMQVLIVTHANMAAGIVSSVDLIMGPQEGLYSIGLAADDSFESFNEKVRNKLAEIVCDDGVLTFTAAPRAMLRLPISIVKWTARPRTSNV